MQPELYRADPSLRGKLRRRLVRLYQRRPATAGLQRPMVSFAFDDAPASAAHSGAEILQARDLKGAYFISAGLAGQSGHMGGYAAPDDVLRLAQNGHEIACHTYSHLDCGQADAPAVQAELDRNARALADWGVSAPVTFAYPYGDVGFPGKRIVASRFALSRGLTPGLIGPGTDLNQAPAVSIEGAQGEAVGRRWLAQAKARQAWVILFAHAVEADAAEFAVSKNTLARLANEAIAEGFEVVTVAEGAKRMRAAA